MKYIYSILSVAAAAMLSASCSFLDAEPNGSYNDENFDSYHELLRGFVDQAYSGTYIPTIYYSTYLAGLGAATDDALYRSETATWRTFTRGATKMSGNPFAAKWNNDYSAINYVNMFLKDNKGFETRYLLNFEDDKVFRHCLQGSAFGLRAWYYFDLLRAFAGKGTNGKMLGVPLMLDAFEAENRDNSAVYRSTVDECVEQILKDCDSAYYHLPYSNKDYPGEAVSTVTGSARYKTLDQVAVDGLRAMVYLFWASPAFNPQNDLSRYENAAKYAAKVMKHKLEKESTAVFGENGFDPLKKFLWTDANTAEVVWPSNFSKSTSTEKAFYPQGFGGGAQIGPTQELVDAFPMANGYPITDSRSGYDPAKPYENRDPRFYANIYYNGSSVLRNTNSEKMYTFETAEGGKDAPGSVGVSPSGYYIKKFLFNGWNPNDEPVQAGYRCVHLISWTQMCLIFAESAGKVTSPDDASKFGYSAKQALAWLRARQTNDGVKGLGAVADPYLDECAAAGGDKFEALVKNEWRVETCFEGERYYNLRRWAKSLNEVNGEIHGIKITGTAPDLKYEKVVVETLNFPSLWNPLPYLDVRRCPNLVQNEGWESWK